MIDWKPIEECPRKKGQSYLLALPLGKSKNVHWRYVVSVWCTADPHIDMDAGWGSEVRHFDPQPTFYAELQPPHRFRRKT